MTEISPGPPAEPEPPRVSVVTEVDDAGTDLAATASALAAQTFQPWEWAIVTTDADLASPIEDERVRVVCGSSRARALREAIAGAADLVVVLDPEERLPPTALEKWFWFLDAHPDCSSVHSTSRDLHAVRGARMTRRLAIEKAGSIDAAAGPVHDSAGFVPIPDAGPENSWGRRSPQQLHPPNEWLPQELPARNRLEKRDRRLLLIAPWMSAGGADKFNLDLLDQLGRLGWQVTVATTIDGPHELYPGYEQRTTDLFPLAHFLPLPDHPRFLRYLIESRRPDVVLVSNSELGYRLLPYLRAQCPGTPLVDFCHSEARHWNNGGYPRFSIEYAELLDLTITASEHLRTWMVDRSGEAGRIEVCYANVDVHAFRPESAARGRLRDRLDLAPDEPIILFAGRISEDKQPRVLADTFARLEQSNLRFTGLVAGDGPDRRSLQRLLTRRGLKGRVRVLGAVDGGGMPPLMAGSDVLFLPSRSEGIALALYEAMACGIPVVGARVGGQAELVTADCGVLVERSTPADEATRYAEALGNLLSDPGRRASMGAAARSRAETLFPLERMGERINELLEHAIELHRSHPKPVPSVQLARASATEAVEVMRLAVLNDWLWREGPERGNVRAIGVAVFGLIRRLGRPAYVLGRDRGWQWLPRMRDALWRLLARVPS